MIKLNLLGDVKGVDDGMYCKVWRNGIDVNIEFFVIGR